MNRPDTSGHRAVAHTADVILEAWGESLAVCLSEAFAAVVATYADVADMVEAGRRRVHLDPGSADGQLLNLLDELIYLLDTSASVPARAELQSTSDGGFDVEIILAERSSVEATGSVPKAVSHSELAVETTADTVRCRFLVDV